MHLYSHDTIKKIIRFDTWELYVLCLGFETLSKVYGDWRFQIKAKKAVKLWAK